MSWFTRKTPLAIVEAQIKEIEKDLMKNQFTADHYQALSNGCQVTLDRLLAKKAEIEKDLPPSTSASATRRVKVPKPSPAPAAEPTEVKTPAATKSVRRVA